MKALDIGGGQNGAGPFAARSLVAGVFSRVGQKFTDKPGTVRWMVVLGMYVFVVR